MPFFVALTQFQIGAYFGAAVCAMQVDRDAFSDLVLISSPMYVEGDREGRVYVCSLLNLVNDFFIKNPSFFFLKTIPTLTLTHMFLPES